MENVFIYPNRLKVSANFVASNFQMRIQNFVDFAGLEQFSLDFEKLPLDVKEKKNSLNSFIAYVFLLSQLPVSDAELARICKQKSLPIELLPLGIMYKVVFKNIRQFLHPDSVQASLWELRGRYLLASIYMEVATSYILEKLTIPKANRFFWGLGGSLLILPPQVGPLLKYTISEFNKKYGIPEIGFELSLADTRSDFKTRENCLLSPSNDIISGPRDKLSGWQNLQRESRREEADFVTRYAKSMANSNSWYFRQRSEYCPLAEKDLGSKIANLPYWIYPTDGKELEKSFARDSFLAELGSDFDFMNYSLESLSWQNNTIPINYFRLDISGMRESLALENDHGIKKLYEKCQQMELFFRKTIPAIFRTFNENQEKDLDVVLLHSTCDDVIFVTKGKNHESLIEQIKASCMQLVKQKIVCGRATLRPGLSAYDLSKAAMRQLVISKNS